MHNNNRHKMRFQDNVYLKLRKTDGQTVKKISENDGYFDVENSLCTQASNCLLLIKFSRPNQ